MQTRDNLRYVMEKHCTKTHHSSVEEIPVKLKSLLEQCKQPECREKLHNKPCYVTSGGTCSCITKNHWEEVEELRSTQEEADTCMFLHAMHASYGNTSVIINAEDTDVIILCIGYREKKKKKSYQKCGTHNRIRYIEIDKLVHSLGESVCWALIGLHAFTGCDTVSAFAGCGNLAALKHLKGSGGYQDAFSLLGQECDISAELFDKLQAFVMQTVCIPSHHL